MSKTPLHFGKIVATPTDSSWSQAYNAGNIVAAVSLSLVPVTNDQGVAEGEKDLSLASMGKKLLNDLEAEYFTLETKNLQTIKQAIITVCEELPEEVHVSFSVTVLIENILYVFLYGPGKVVMKREDKLGTLLENSQDNKLTTASGYIQHNDIVVLQTQQFAHLVSSEELLPCLASNTLSEMTDILSPIIHKQQEGGAAAIAFLFQDENATLPVEHTPQPVSHEEQHVHTPHTTSVEEPIEEPTLTPPTPSEPAVHHPRQPMRLPSFSMSHKRRLFLTIGLILVIVFIGSIFFSIQKQQEVQTESLYQSMIVPAQKKYDEGQSLLDLNKTLAIADFTQAKQMIDDAKSKLPANSPQAKQANDLLDKINSSLDTAAQLTTSDTKVVDSSTSVFLNSIIQNSSATAFTQDDKYVYLANSDGVISIRKSDNTTKTIIKNDSAWKNAGGLGAYLANFYLLDTQGGILKYVPAGSGYNKTNYFASGVSPDLSQASGMTINGSIWVVSSDGSITKYTKGRPDTLTIKGLDKPLKSPSQIYTSVDINNVYVLDNGNGRLVVLDQNGNFVAQYATGIIKTAKAFDVLEKDKKVYILSNGKVYELDLK